MKKRISAFLVLFVLFSMPLGANQERRPGKVYRVIDGDTFDLETGERVRLIGIDTSEYQPHEQKMDFYGKEAADYARDLLDRNKVYLEKDIEEKDRYGRTLAYVYLDKGEFVNLLLVENGYARAKYYPPNGRYYSLLKKAQDNAKKRRVGIWKKRAFLDNLAY